VEGGDLRASIQRTRLRSLSLLCVVAALGVSLVLPAPLPVGAVTKHAARPMPQLVGRTRAQVYATMRADQLYFRTRGPGSANATWVSVVAQSPPPGTMVAWHFEATLSVSMRAPHGARRMPRLVGRTRAQTYAVMRKAQLFFTTHGPGSSTGKWVVVLAQSPAPGTLLKWHAVASLRVSTRRPVAKKPRPKPKPTTTTTLRRHPTTTTTRPVTTTSATTTTTTPLDTTTTYPGEVTTTTIAPTTTTSVRAVTTTTRKVTTTTVKKRPKRYRIGDATWYSYIPGHCATWYLPFGTRIVVRDLATGRAIRCIVTDREAAHGNRVVDLSETQFAQLAPLHVGVIRVKVSW